MHKCEHFLPEVACPVMDFREIGSGRDPLFTRFVHDANEDPDFGDGEDDPPFEKPPASDDPIKIFPFGDKVKEGKAKAGVDVEKELREAQGRVPNPARAGATANALSQLAHQGMTRIPTFENGGVQWMLQFISDPAIRSLFFGQVGQRQGAFSSAGQQLVKAFETQSALESLQASKQLEPQEGNGFGSSFVGRLIVATAAAGGVASVAFGANKVRQRVGQFRPTTPVGSAPGGGGGAPRAFPAPTFRPGFARSVAETRVKTFAFHGGPPTD